VYTTFVPERIFDNAERKDGTGDKDAESDAWVRKPGSVKKEGGGGNRKS
jgi:hypothetical protein